MLNGRSPGRFATGDRAGSLPAIAGGLKSMMEDLSGLRRGLEGCKGGEGGAGLGMFVTMS